MNQITWQDFAVNILSNAAYAAIVLFISIVYKKVSLLPKDRLLLLIGILTVAVISIMGFWSGCVIEAPGFPKYLNGIFISAYFSFLINGFIWVTLRKVCSREIENDSDHWIMNILFPLSVSSHLGLLVLGIFSIYALLNLLILP